MELTSQFDWVTGAAVFAACFVCFGAGIFVGCRLPERELKPVARLAPLLDGYR